MKPEDLLRGIGAGATQFGAALPGGWRLAVQGLGAAVQLVGDLVAAGRDPVAAITRIRSIAIGASEDDAEIDAEIARRIGGQ